MIGILITIINTFIAVLWIVAWLLMTPSLLVFGVLLIVTAWKESLTPEPVGSASREGSDDDPDNGGLFI